MDKETTYLGNGTVRDSGADEPVHYSLIVRTSENGTKSAQGRLTGTSGAIIDRLIQEERPATLTLETGDSVEILLGDGDHLTRQYSFVVNGAIPPLPNPRMRA